MLKDPATRNPKDFSNSEIELEMIRCGASPLYFIMNYVMIYDPAEHGWIPFELWGAQRYLLKLFREEKKVVVLKPRQVGISWLVIAYTLWCMLFRPTFVALFFSHTQDEAKYLLGVERMRGMYEALPTWMKAQAVTKDDVRHWELSNGSSVRALSPNRGDSYSANLVFLDEADLYPNLKVTMGRAEPTVEAGGQIIMVSRSNKEKPMSLFKSIYRNARDGISDYVSAFLPWWVHPDRTQAWYDQLMQVSIAREGSSDTVDAQYPETDEQALRANTFDKRLLPSDLARAFQPINPLTDTDIKRVIDAERYTDGNHWNPERVPAINGLEVFALPIDGVEYSVGIDSAEGKKGGDDSSVIVVRVDTLEEVCKLSAKIEFTTLAHYADEIGKWYNYAMLMPERNNHGHAVIQWLLEHSGLAIGDGHDGNEGWLSSARGKALLYSNCATALQDENPTIHSNKTYNQLQSIERSTLRAPENMHDDDADAWALAVTGAMNYKVPYTGVW